MRITWWKHLLFLAIAPAILIFVIGCGQQPPATTDQTDPVASVDEEAPATQVDDGPITDDEDVEEVVVPEVELDETPKALVTFLTGEVFVRRGDEWAFVDIGAELAARDSIRVGADSYAELQLGDMATIRVEENTQVDLRVLLLETDRTAVRLGMESGSILSRVNRLTGNDSYEIRSATAVAGVRGTEFRTRVGDDGTTEVAVRDGRVRVRPVIEEVEDEVEAALQTAAIPEAVIERFDEAATEVAPNRVVRLDTATSTRAATALAPVAQTVRTLLTEAEIEPADERLAVLGRAAQAAAQTLPTAQDVQPEEAQALARIDEINTVPVVADEERPTAPALVRLTVATDPADAEVYVNGRFVGIGGFSALYEQGSSHRIVVRREGYTEKEVPVVLNVVRGRSLTISLRPVPQARVEVSTVPADAEILLGSQVVGSGTFAGEFPVGTELEFLALRDGYLPAEASLVVENEEPVALRLELEEVPVVEQEPPATETATTEEPEPEPEPVLETVTIRATPADASILLNGRAVGRGAFTDSFEVGSVLRFRVEAPDHFAADYTVVVREGGENAVAASLERRPVFETITIRTEPPSAAILVDRQAVGTGEFSRRYEEGTVLRVEATLDGYFPQERTVRVREGGTTSYLLRLERMPVIETVRFEVEPAEAEILVNGRRLAPGTRSADYEAGTELSVVVRADGYFETERELTVREGAQNRLAVALQRQPIIERVEISATPQTAQIIVNGQEAGRGRVSADYEAGTELSVVVRADGYFEAERELTVREGAQNRLAVALQRQPVIERVSLRVQPENAEIILDGSSVGRGSFTGDYEAGTALRFVVRAEGYEESTLTVRVAEGAANSHEVALARQVRTIRIEADPADAVIAVDGQTSSGTLTIERPVGSTLTVEATRRGYAPASRSITVSASGPTQFGLELERRPVVAVASAAEAPLVRGLVAGENAVYFADSAGMVGAVSAEGSLLWTTRTPNRPNENSLPVYAGGRLYFSGAQQLVVIDASRGTVLHEEGLNADQAHLFGRRVAVGSGLYWYPTNSELVLRSVGTHEIVGRLALPGGSTMAPVIDGSRVLIAGDRGDLFIIDATSRELVANVATSAVQPVAQAAAIWNGRAYFQGRRGTVAAVDLGEQSVAWTARLPAGSFVDPVAGPAGVYFFVRNAVHGLSHDGQDLFSPIQGAAAAPVYHNGSLYIAFADGRLEEIDPARGSRRRSVTLPASLSTQPAVVGDYLAVGSTDGRVFIVDPEGMSP